MAVSSRPQLLLLLASLFHPIYAIYNPLLERGISSANILVPRRGRGGSGGTYYETCQETYGSGYAECYGSCYNAGAGEKCCDGNYSCPNGQYCGYGSYSYCCYDSETPQQCSSQYAIAQPPAGWQPGDANAPASITDPATPTVTTPTSTYVPQQYTSTPNTFAAQASVSTSSLSSDTYTPSSYTPYSYSSSSDTYIPSSYTPYSYSSSSDTYTSLTLPSITPFSFTPFSISTPTTRATAIAGGDGAGAVDQGAVSGAGRIRQDMGSTSLVLAAVLVWVGTWRMWL